jgi:hypothetical protein
MPSFAATSPRNIHARMHVSDVESYYIVQRCIHIQLCICICICTHIMNMSIQGTTVVTVTCIMYNIRHTVQTYMYNVQCTSCVTCVTNIMYTLYIICTFSHDAAVCLHRVTAAAQRRLLRHTHTLPFLLAY